MDRRLDSRFELEARSTVRFTRLTVCKSVSVSVIHIPFPEVGDEAQSVFRSVEVASRPVG